MNENKNPANKLMYDSGCTMLGTSLYGIGALGCITFGVMVPSMALVTYICYGLVGICLGSIATITLKNDIKEYKEYINYTKNYEHFPIEKIEYESRPRYKIDREIDCKVEDFYKESSDYPTNFVYEKEDSQYEENETISKKKKYRG